MTDARRKAAEEWMRDAFRAAFEDNFGSMVPTAMLAHEAGQECGEKREREATVKWLRAWSARGVSLIGLANCIEAGEHLEEK